MHLACFVLRADQVYRQIKKPSLSSGKIQIYLQGPQQLEEYTRPNLAKKLSEIIDDKTEIAVTSTVLPISLKLRISFV